MLSIVYLYLALLLVSCLIFALLFYRIIYKKGRQDANRYRLFKVRDDLIFLVAKGTINENDFIFRTFYDMANTYIQHIHRFNLREINKAMSKTKEKNSLDKTHEFVARIEQELEHKDREVRNVIEEFLETMLYILMRNSLSLRFIIKMSIKCTFIEPVIKKLKAFTRIFAVQEVAFRNYQIHDEIYKSLVKASY